MKKSFFKRAAVLAMMAVLLVLTLVPSFATAYSTYTYSIEGTQLDSPNAYEPDKRYNSDTMGITVPDPNAPDKLCLPLEKPTDLTVDCDGNIYILDETTLKIDAVNSKTVYRLIVLDPYFRFLYELTEFKSESGAKNSFSRPRGVSTTEDFIYIADTENARIVVFERLNEGREKPEQAYRILGQPQSDVFNAEKLYRPVAVASDDNHVYVVAENMEMGVISMDIKGNFMGFIGAQKVSSNALAVLWRMFQTDEQKVLSQKYISTPFNNIVMDESGFIYVTINFKEGSSEEQEQQDAIINKKTGAEYAPVKKLNTNGDDILNRGGFFPPSGEVMVAKKSTDGAAAGASTIIDVAVGPEETWSIIDAKRQRIFTYDKNGNLLFAFGDSGDQLGNLEQITAISYQLADGMSNIIVLDKGDGGIAKPTVNVYTRTEYGDLLIAALRNDNNRNYQEAITDYENILERNLNFDAAYIGKAKALYRDGDYEKAMEEYSYAYNTSGYSQAFKMYRKDWVSKWIWVIPIVVIVVVVGFSMFLKYAAKVNAKTAITSGKRTFVQEILFGFHLIFHPFDGYWDLKHEKRGSLRGAAFYIALTIAVFTYNSAGRSYMYNPTGEFQSVGMQIAAVGIPVVLFATANWCITTLFDGEGSIKDILITTGYSLLPLVLLTIPATLLTHVLSSAESGIITLLNTFAFIWVGLLLFFGIMVTQDYSFMKNILTVIVTIVGMAFIMFLIILFVTLVSDIVGLVRNIITEMSYRM
jgi:tetratricopeptide (TPR) repeat protein